MNGVDLEDENELKGNDVGFVVGGAVQFGQVFVDVRYNWRLINILKDDPSGDEVKTRTLGIMVGFQFK